MALTYVRDIIRHVSDAAGIVLIVAGGIVALATAFLLRSRLPALVVTVVLFGCGVAMGIGALAVQDDVSTTEWILVPLLMSVLAPAHVRVVLGPFGRRS
jgi:ABC-type transport system involved in cytochrome c biogenesis permease subunit